MAVEHTFITKNGLKTKLLTPMKAIREKCFDCTGWEGWSYIRDCPSKDCALYAFREGNNPKTRKPTKKKA